MTLSFTTLKMYGVPLLPSCYTNTCISQPSLKKNRIRNNGDIDSRRKWDRKKEIDKKKLIKINSRVVFLFHLNKDLVKSEQTEIRPLPLKIKTKLVLLSLNESLANLADIKTLNIKIFLWSFNAIRWDIKEKSWNLQTESRILNIRYLHTTFT